MVRQVSEAEAVDDDFSVSMSRLQLKLLIKSILPPVVRDANLRLVREFWVGPHMPVESGAPEQPSYFAALLQPYEPSAASR